MISFFYPRLKSRGITKKLRLKSRPPFCKFFCFTKNLHFALAYLRLKSRGILRLKLKQAIASLTQYQNALQLLRWQTQQTVKKSYLERKNKISELEKVIATLTPTDSSTGQERQAAKKQAHSKRTSEFQSVASKF